MGSNDKGGTHAISWTNNRIFTSPSEYSAAPMKRYRIISQDYDTRAVLLGLPSGASSETGSLNPMQQHQARIRQQLLDEFGILKSEMKLRNFIEIGAAPMSIIAFHNHFFAQIRAAFVMGAYYPALTGACALGERILNHLILELRDEFISTPEYKSVFRKDSFDDWDLVIKTLSSWKVLLPKAAVDFSSLKEMRHYSLHFRPEVDTEPRIYLLNAILCLQRIVGEQFSGFGPQEWFITGVPGEVYLKKEWESNPFIKKVYLPNSFSVGYRHRVESLGPPIHVADDFTYEVRDISDDEFVRLRILDTHGSENNQPTE